MTHQTKLTDAYRYCQQFAQSHYENFPVASLLLPKHLRQPISVIYAFARTADDIADEGDANNQQRLEALTNYQQQLDLIKENHAGKQSLIFLALTDVITRHQLPLTPFYDLLSAFKQDVVQNRYQTQHDVIEYCKRSANPIGQLLLSLNGDTSTQQFIHANAICTALQLLNFYQDIEQDWHENNRLYLPLDELAQYGLNERDLMKGDTTAFAPLIRDKYRDIATLFIHHLNLGEMIPGRLGWEIRTITLMGILTLKALSAQTDNHLTSRPRLSTKIRFIVGTKALIKPIYRQTCQDILNQVLKDNQT
tara:strand:- start:411 stop:1331 length:921 start_codon:yes stop_codon:yes gene_type:complete